MGEIKRALIVVRTYPTPAKKGVEVSCTAAITDKGEWLRLFPVPYRLLESDKRFGKYQWIEVDVVKASDPRPESYKIRPASIKIVSPILSADNAWQNRKEFVFPLKAHCLCCVQKRRDDYGFPTLGIIKPKTIHRLSIKAETAEWTSAQAAALGQGDLFQRQPAKELEKIPFSFRYEFTCDEEDCKGHSLSCTDWEMGESWRKWKEKYGDDWEVYFRRKYELEMINDKDLHFFIGTIHAHPGAWIIVGLFYPPKFAPLPLFDLPIA